MNSWNVLATFFSLFVGYRLARFLVARTSRSYSWSNWDGRRRAVLPKQNFHQPANKSELVQLLRHLSSIGAKIKVVGGSHSWSSIAQPENGENSHLINLDRMNHVLNVDREHNTVRVEAGIRIRDLNRELWSRGFSLPVFGSTNGQSIAGAMATGTHGSGLTNGITPCMANEFELLKLDGTLLNITRSEELFNAVGVHLGALGIITQVTLQVVPSFYISDERRVFTLDQLSVQLDTLLHDYKFFKFWWIPPSDTCYAFLQNPSEQQHTVGKLTKIARDVQQYCAENFMMKLTRYFPPASSFMINTVAGILRVTTLICHLQKLTIPVEKQTGSDRSRVRNVFPR
jgi:hypothetical protein